SEAAILRSAPATNPNRCLVLIAVLLSGVMIRVYTNFFRLSNLLNLRSGRVLRDAGRTGKFGNGYCVPELEEELEAEKSVNS
ncbi:MAG: hypothetical protein MUQ25_00085, partial [Candidatus Aminicenantes bacterium]|nr:hypothetical protein [Candidatus Aminicenantes bacterium]